MGRGRGNRLVSCFTRGFAGVEDGSRVLQGSFGLRDESVGATEHAPRDRSYLLERRHGLAEIIERGTGARVAHSRSAIDL